MLEHATGLFDDIEESDYHKSPGISKHGLDLIHKSPAHYVGHIMEETQPLIFGGAFHAYILEREVFEKKYAVCPFDDFRTKAAKEWKQENSERRVISLSDFAQLKEMETALLNHPTAYQLLAPNDGEAELSAYWINNLYGETLCRARADFFNTVTNTIIDLKTCRCAGASQFARDVVNYRYHVQAAFYTDGFEALNIPIESFIFIAIEKTPPYGIGVYELKPADLNIGRFLYQQDLRVYKEAYVKDEWPGYPEEIRVLDLPTWATHLDVY